MSRYNSVIIVLLVSFLNYVIAEWDGPVIKIGSALSRDSKSKWSWYSQSYRNVFNIWQEFIHRSGGIKIGNTSYGVDFVVENIGGEIAATQIEQTATAVRTLLDQKVKAVIAPYTSFLTEAAAQAINTINPDIPILAPGAAATGVYKCQSNIPSCGKNTGRRFPNLFGTLGNASRYFNNILNFARLVDVKSIALVEDGLEAGIFPKEACEGANNIATALGLKVVYNGQFDINTVDQLSKLNPDLVLTCTYQDSCQTFMKRARAANWIPRGLASTVCLSHPSTLVSLGKDSREMMGPSQWHPDHNIYFYNEDENNPVTMFSKNKDIPAPEQFRRLYNLYTGGNDPTYHIASVLASLYALHSALLSAQSLDGRNIIEALKKVKMGSFWGYIEFDQNGQMAANYLGDFTVEQVNWKTNKVEVVAPIYIATSDFQYPMHPFAERECLDNNKCNGDNGRCRSDGTCMCFSPYYGSACDKSSAILKILEGKHCLGLYVTTIVFLSLVIVVTIIIICLDKNRRQWAARASAALNATRDKYELSKRPDTGLTFKLDEEDH